MGKDNNRRKFIKDVGIGAAALGTAGLAGVLSSCKGQNQEQAAVKEEPKAKTIEWKMVTTWPPHFPMLGEGADNLAKWIDEMSGGRLKIKVYGGGELVPPLGVFDAVSQGTAEMGIVIIARKTEFQIPVKGNQINMVLEDIIVLNHGVCQCLRGIIPVYRSQKVGLIIQDIPPVVMAGHKIDEAFDKSFKRCHGHSGQPPGVIGVDRFRGKQVNQPPQVKAGEIKAEFQFRKPLVHGDIL